MLPLVVDLRGRHVIVVGAGRVGVHKTRQLLEAHARVTVLTDEIVAPIPVGVAGVVVRRYQRGDLAGAFLVVSATGNAMVNDQIFEEAHDRDIFINVVDDPARSTFFFTAVHRDGDVIVSVSTSGASPALARWVRNALAKSLPTNLGAVATRLRAERRALHAAGHSTEGYAWNERVSALIFDVNAEPLRRE